MTCQPRPALSQLTASVFRIVSGFRDGTGNIVLRFSAVANRSYTVYGATKTPWTTLSSPSSIGSGSAGTFTVGDTTGWQVGDTITVTAKYADVAERTGRTGKMVFVFTELTFRNQHGEVVAKGRNTGIMRE